MDIVQQAFVPPLIHSAPVTSIENVRSLNIKVYLIMLDNFDSYCQPICRYLSILL